MLFQRGRDQKFRYGIRAIRGTGNGENAGGSAVEVDTSADNKNVTRKTRENVGKMATERHSTLISRRSFPQTCLVNGRARRTSSSTTLALFRHGGFQRHGGYISFDLSRHEASERASEPDGSAEPELASRIAAAFNCIKVNATSPDAAQPLLRRVYKWNTL